MTPDTAPSKKNPSAYVGRFAPSPSGPLHFGSLISALASFLDARAAAGRWLVRIDDIDPPREEPGAADSILNALQAHGLEWDGEIIYQSQRHPAYQAMLKRLQQQKLIYPCNCTRQRLMDRGGIYDGHCRIHPPDTTPVALRLKLYDLPEPHAHLPDTLQFDDLIQGPQQQNLAREVGDAIVRRKDELYAYQLAVVVDDAAQGITDIIRGSDLLPVTARQIRFFELLGVPVPRYGHVPVVLDQSGRKLSKQNHAPALDNAQAAQNLWQALVFLGQNPPLSLNAESVSAILQWAMVHWRREALVGLEASVPNC
ncbi:MAG TPA: tRNA glutamyl-Q(34) synthetase GluQRS [Cellvibrionaceae bacterium]